MSIDCKHPCQIPIIKIRYNFLFSVQTAIEILEVFHFSLFGIRRKKRRGQPKQRPRPLAKAMDKEKGKEERQEEKVGKAKARARREQALTADDESNGKRAKSETESVRSEPRGSQDNNTGLVDLSEGLVTS